MAKIPPNSVGLAGEFAVLSQLTLRGFNAGMTLGNTKGIDILVHDPRSGARYQVEVKSSLNWRRAPTISKFFGRIEASWTMSTKHESNLDPDLFYCFVNINGDREDNAKFEFRFFIIPSRIVADYVKVQHAAWLAVDPKHKDTDMRNFRLASELGAPLKCQAPLAKEWENNWDFCREPLA